MPGPPGLTAWYSGLAPLGWEWVVASVKLKYLEVLSVSKGEIDREIDRQIDVNCDPECTGVECFGIPQEEQEDVDGERDIWAS